MTTMRKCTLGLLKIAQTQKTTIATDSLTVLIPIAKTKQALEEKSAASKILIVHLQKHA
jgi:hypothetical protein